MSEPHPRRSIRYRRCPNCQTVGQASAFRRATGPTNVAGQLQRRRCPRCGFTGPLMGFPLAERPPDAASESVEPTEGPGL